ncbi:MAG: helix-turn-helix domain-containing protein [Chitinophagaceae bacterium]|nr:helix-turn-helix domain-containing protein [Chitinophagaceae bacterium]
MIKKLTNEEWKPLVFPGGKFLLKNYALSSKGRLASYLEDIYKDGKVLTGSVTTGYRTLNLHRPGHNGTIYIHREMAKLFLKKPSSKHKYVIHVNHERSDNSVKNLRWVTVKEMIEHQQNSPAKLAYKEIQATRTVGRKLNSSQVKTIKKLLASRDRDQTIRQIAEQYGVSDMTLYRIKSGENWSRI